MTSVMPLVSLGAQRPVVRAAVVADVPRIVEMGCRFLDETEYATRLARNPAQMATFVTWLIQQPTGTALFLEERGPHLIGMFGIQTFVHPLSGEQYAAELFWWVDSDARGHGLRLLRRAEQWAAEQGAVKLQMIAPTARVCRLYDRLGYQQIEVGYERSLP